MNEAGDTPFHLECIRGDRYLEMIKCLDDGKGNLDSKYILRGSFLSVSNGRLSFSFIQQFLSCKLGFIETFSWEKPNSVHNPSIVRAIW